MLLTVPAEILILIVVALLLVMVIVAVVFYAASKRIANPQDDPQLKQDEKNNRPRYPSGY